MAKKLEEALKKYGYDQGEVFIPSIVHQGGVIIESKNE